MNVFFHNKGIEMINLTKILNSKKVTRSVPAFFSNITPPMVSYSYTKTIANKIFNFKQAVKELDFDVGTSNMTCNCSSSEFKYIPTGHVITGNLDIIKDKSLRKLIQKGPSFREQNNINWDLNAKICREAIRNYKDKWAKRENIDRRVLHEREHTVYSCVERRVQYLKHKCNNVRKK